VDLIGTHQEWQEEELVQMVPGGAAFPLVSDPDGRIGSLYGVYDPGKKVNLRGRFVIDPTGILQSIEILGEPVGRNISESLRQLKALQHYEKTGELMPCGWQPGKPTLSKESEAKKKAGKIWEVWKPRNAF
jgi:alkyl hydroperoxide reductase subunit AhpC